MKQDALHNLRTYWEKLRAGRVAPYRAELDPRAFEDVLENMFILEQLNPSQIRVRLAGMSLCEMMGMEVRGMPPEAIMAAPHRTAFAQHLNAVLSGPTVIELELSAQDLDNNEIRAQMLLLPLRSDFGEVTRVLGCVVTEEAEIRAPVNFSIVAQRHSVVHVDGTDTADRGLPGFAEPAASYAPPSSPAPIRSVTSNPDVEQSAPRRGHLKIVSKS